MRTHEWLGVWHTFFYYSDRYFYCFILGMFSYYELLNYDTEKFGTGYQLVGGMCLRNSDTHLPGQTVS